MENRRSFIKKAATGAVAASFGSVGLGFSAKGYSRIIGANDRINVALMGCGRRVGAYYDAITDANNKVDLLYICDVMQKQREKVARQLKGKLANNPELVTDIRKVFEDKKVDAIFNATPDHWHAPGTWMALESGKHVFVEKPCSHNPYENELLVAYQKKYGRVVQMGNQQRSDPVSIEAVSQIHNGAIGEPYKAVAFYSNTRGKVPVPEKAPVPEGLDWDLFQGPSPHTDYMHDTWDYNWHWYGWNWGTAETGNNAAHEFDIARWALKGEFPERVSVEATKRHFIDDGWTMYDTMDATFIFPGNKIIKWDGKSRNGYQTYGSGRGTIIYGTEGTVFINRNGYKLYDRKHTLINESASDSDEAGIALGGGGSMTTRHIVNFFDAIRGKASQRSPIDEGAKSTLLCHLANISYRTGKSFNINPENGHIQDKDAMKLWKRDYEPGWEPGLQISYK
ncbi:MAG: Gfo/Idh/MocA family oxidoreductase [Bacteroidales bacterium]|nr:MAG: Gfo/Idh/MocA family oxidoreductase [Bacteroidales bacterium]